MQIDRFKNKTVVVLRHLMFENLGTLTSILIKRNYQVIYIDVGVDHFDFFLEDADLLIILGGPISVYDHALYPYLNTEIELVRRRLASGLPILGICLGAQIIAKACGAEVKPMGYKEIGFYPITMVNRDSNTFFKKFGDEMIVLHWHGDTFELPSNARLLASSKLCANQAFSIGNNIIAFQFHLEVDCCYIEQWLIGHALELSSIAIDLHLLRHQAKEYAEIIKQQSEHIFGTWLDSLE